MLIPINLLPEAYRKPKASSLQQFPRSPLALMIAGVLVGLWCLVAGTRLVLQHRVKTLTAHLERQQPQKAAADALQASVKDLREQVALHQRLDRDRSDWAPRLEALAEVTPDGVWLTHLAFDPSKTLDVHGAAIGRGGEEMARIRQFVKDLKAHPAFAALIRDVQIESIKSVFDGDIEVVRFNVVCPLTTVAAKPSKKGKR